MSRWRLHDASTGLTPVDLEQTIRDARPTTAQEALSRIGSRVMADGFPSYAWARGRGTGPRLRDADTRAWRSTHRGAPAMIVDDGSGPILFVVAAALPHRGPHRPEGCIDGRPEAFSLLGSNGSEDEEG